MKALPGIEIKPLKWICYLEHRRNQIDCPLAIDGALESTCTAMKGKSWMRMFRLARTLKSSQFLDIIGLSLNMLRIEPATEVCSINMLHDYRDLNEIRLHWIAPSMIPNSINCRVDDRLGRRWDGLHRYKSDDLCRHRKE